MESHRGKKLWRLSSPSHHSKQGQIEHRTLPELCSVQLSFDYPKCKTFLILPRPSGKLVPMFSHLHNEMCCTINYTTDCSGAHTGQRLLGLVVDVHMLLFIHSEQYNKRTPICVMPYFYWYFWAKLERKRVWCIKPHQCHCSQRRAFSSIDVGRVFNFFFFQKMLSWFTVSLLLSVTEYNTKRSQGIQAFHAQFQLRNCSIDAI